MWRTVDGLRTLSDPEARLIGRAAEEMAECLSKELEDAASPRAYGMDWFDQWDVEQRIWLLEQVVMAMWLTTCPPPPTAAIFEATVDAIFCHVVEAIGRELEMTTNDAAADDWRSLLVNAFECQHGRCPIARSDAVDIRRWQALAFQVAETIMGPTSYLQAERFRDREARHAQRFLRLRGLPDDYLQRIPPVIDASQASISLQRLRQLVNR